MCNYLQVILKIHYHVCIIKSTSIVLFVFLALVIFVFSCYKMKSSKRNWPRFLRRTLIKLTGSLIVASLGLLEDLVSP